jgi:hypothetical protein
MFRTATNVSSLRRSAAVDEGTDFVEGGRLGSRRRMERDNQIIEALETSASMVYRVRKQLVEEGPRGCVEPQVTSSACR